MKRHLSLSVAAGLALALVSAAILAQAPRGLDFSSYLSLKRGMTEGEVLAIAGPPDVQSDDGVAFSGPRGGAAVKTYTFLPTVLDPYTTTISFVGGQAAEIRRDGKYAPASGARGLDFRSYLSLKRGMTEGEVLAIAGSPDVQAEEGAVVYGRGRTALRVRTYTYLPTGADPHTTTITLVGGRVTEIRRDRKF